MPGETYSPNMNLVVPGAGITPGPAYATDLNASLSLIDVHDHSTGKGVQITPAGLNISSDLSFVSNNATNLRASKYTSQAAVLSDLSAFYVVNGDAYYNDASGGKIRLTQSGALAGTPGSISGLGSPASATYVSASSSFVWQSGANTPANLDAASLLLRNLSAGSFALTLAPPTLSSNYALTLPTIPTATKIVTIDVSGNIAANYTVDGSTLVVASNVLGVPANGITATQIAANAVTATQIAANAVTATQIAANAVTQQKRAALNYVTAGSATSYSTTSTVATGIPGCSLTYTTTGRPVYIGLQGSQIAGTTVSGSAVGDVRFGLMRNGVALVESALTMATGAATGGMTHAVPPGSIWFIDTPAASTYTYSAYYYVVSTGTTAFVNAVTLVVYEL